MAKLDGANIIPELMEFPLLVLWRYTLLEEEEEEESLQDGTLPSAGAFEEEHLHNHHVGPLIWQTA